MSVHDSLWIMGLGGVLILLGILATWWGIREEGSYFNALSRRGGDMREFLNHWPERPEPGALKIGGRLSIAIGILTLIMGGIFWLMTPAGFAMN